MTPIPFCKTPLFKAKFIQRYKRFFADVSLENKEILTIHCANSGSMKSLLEPENKIWCSDSQNPERKLQFSWELVELSDGLACVNTQRANQLTSCFLKDAVSMKSPPCSHSPETSSDFLNFTNVQAEVKISQKSRLDFCVSGENKQLYVEVKSVTYRGNETSISFPDAVTERGQKHLQDLMNLVSQGHEAMILFAIMRGTKIEPKALIQQFSTAHQIDPTYSKLFQEAQEAGVKVRFLISDLTTEGFGYRYFGALNASN
jgi:sugar fermentation stimulation protein A